MKEEVERVLSKYAGVELTFESPGFLEFVVVSGSIERYFNEVFKELVSLGYQPLLTESAGHEVVRVFRVGLRGFNKVIYHVLAAATVLAVAVTGYFSSLSFYECLGGRGDFTLSTAIFVLSVLVPLALHELGHFVASRKADVPTPLPMFIPAPVISPLGTFGAVIAVRFLPRDRKSLAMLGISGPLVGVIVSSLTLVVTLSMSPAVRVEELTCPGGVTPIGFAPMLMYIMLLTGLVQYPEGTIVILHPAALASMLLLLIHFANLLPIGQLDGGHVLRSVTDINLHRAISLLVPLILIVLSIFSPTYRWLGFFAVLAILISGFRPHIGYSNQLSKMSSQERLYLLLIYLLLLFVTAPVPL